MTYREMTYRELLDDVKAGRATIEGVQAFIGNTLEPALYARDIARLIGVARAAFDAGQCDLLGLALDRLEWLSVYDPTCEAFMGE